MVSPSTKVSDSLSSRAHGATGRTRSPAVLALEWRGSRTERRAVLWRDSHFLATYIFDVFSEAWTSAFSLIPRAAPHQGCGCPADPLSTHTPHPQPQLAGVVQQPTQNLQSKTTTYYYLFWFGFQRTDWVVPLWSSTCSCSQPMAEAKFLQRFCTLLSDARSGMAATA